MFQSFEENYVVYRGGRSIPEAISHSQLQRETCNLRRWSNEYVIVQDFNDDWWRYSEMDSNDSMQLPLAFC